MKTENLKWLLLAFLALIWGSSFILILRGLDALSPLQVGSLRMIAAGAFLLLIGFRKLPQIPLGKWKYVALTGITGNFIPAFLFALAETEVNSTVSAILNSLTPLNTLIFGLLLFRMDVGRHQVLGILVGFAGCMLLVYGGSSESGGDWRYAFFILLATICYALNIHFVKRYLSDLSPLTISAGNFAVLILPAAAILLSTGITGHYTEHAIQVSAFYIVLLGLLSTGISNVVFYRLIQMSTPLFASNVTYLIPIVAAGWGLLAGERLGWMQLIGAAVILSGVYLSSRKR